MPKLNDQWLTPFKGKNVCGRIIGIDFYHLENFEGKKHKWPSYTLVSEKGGLFKRYWITDWGKSGWFLWTTCKTTRVPKNKQIIAERSGIATIEFVGDRGLSTPAAALVVFGLGNDQYYSMERFTGSDVMYFSSQKIPRPKLRKQ